MLELSEEDVVLGAGGLVGWAPSHTRSSSLIADPPPPHPQRTQLGVPGPGVGVRRRRLPASLKLTVHAPTDSKEEPEKEGIRRQRVVDKVFPNQDSRLAGRVGEGRQEAPGGEGSWAHTAEPTGQPQGPSPGSTPQGVAYPHVQPSTGPEASERLGQEAQGPRGVLSCPETTPCCSALCRGPVTYMGRRVRLAFALPGSQQGLRTGLASRLLSLGRDQLCVRRAVFSDPFIA